MATDVHPTTTLGHHTHPTISPPKLSPCRHDAYTPVISVIVPVYNVGLYLQQCLDSLSAQTYPNLEILVINDGSTDGSGAICDAHAAADPRFRVIHKSNQGLVAARQTGLQESTGSYIGFVDGDDWVDPEMFDKLHAALAASDADMAIGSMVLEYPDATVAHRPASPAGVYAKPDLQRYVYPTMIFTGQYYEFGVLPAVWLKLFRRTLLEKHLPPIPSDIQIGEDVACTYPCLLDSEKIVVLDDALYHYRQHSTSMLRGTSVDQVPRALVLYRYLRAHTSGHARVMGVQLEIFLVHRLWEYARRTYVGYSPRRLRRQWHAAHILLAEPESQHAARVAQSIAHLPREVRIFTRLLASGSPLILFLGLWIDKAWRQVSRSWHRRKPE